MAVFINLDRPLVSLVLVNGEIQRVKYEALPTICFYCGKYRHLKEMCPSLTVDPRNDSVKTTVDGEPREAKDRTRKMLKTAYGPWMLVERRSC
ncbi:hypothetical protein PVK06_027942 [Gossypium arboreum]|uniref:CCHC-type domain-containing protein n=1 Tax=Gossypium arboreum TaxID=29729 RepID=A0ABR0P1L9_GOSAR|nr:hypothetical protein PVK06_027942 [Gossypium arboreum]